MEGRLRDLEGRHRVLENRLRKTEDRLREIDGRLPALDRSDSNDYFAPIRSELSPAPMCPTPSLPRCRWPWGWLFQKGADTHSQAHICWVCGDEIGEVGRR